MKNKKEMNSSIKENLLYVSNYNYLKLLLDDLFNKNEYKYIYVSIGSKWNEEKYDYLDMYGKKYERKTNSHLQMIPNFIKDKEEKTLLICMDQFRDIENRMINFDIVQKDITDNMDFIFYDEKENIISVKNFIGLVVETIERKNILPENFIVINYVRFQRPNPIEYSMENDIPDIIFNLLKPTIYIECFYQWFGYQLNLYNMIYNYNRYRQLFRFIEILCALNTLLHSDVLNLENLIHVYNFYKSQTNHSYFNKFLENVVDISSYSINKGKLFNTLMQSIDYL
jgi:hypothetical protein